MVGNAKVWCVLVDDVVLFRGSNRSAGKVFDALMSLRAKLIDDGLVPLTEFPRIMLIDSDYYV